MQITDGDFFRFSRKPAYSTREGKDFKEIVFDKNRGARYGVLGDG